MLLNTACAGVQRAWPEAGVLEELCAVLRENAMQKAWANCWTTSNSRCAKCWPVWSTSAILVDRNGIEAFGQELQTALGAELRAIYDEVGYEFNVNSPKQLGKALFEDLGLPTRKKRKAVIPPTPKRWRACRDYSPSSATSCSTEPTRS